MRSDFGRSFSRFHRCPQGQVGTTGNIEEAYKELFGIIIRKSYLAAAWMKTGIIPEGVLVNLETGNGYKLGNGNWKVAGDSTSYSGGTEFYVKKDGSYTFGKQ